MTDKWMTTSVKKNKKSNVASTSWREDAPFFFPRFNYIQKKRKKETRNIFGAQWFNKVHITFDARFFSFCHLIDKMPNSASNKHKDLWQVGPWSVTCMPTLFKEKLQRRRQHRHEWNKHKPKLQMATKNAIWNDYKNNSSQMTS